MCRVALAWGSVSFCSSTRFFSSSKLRAGGSTGSVTEVKGELGKELGGYECLMLHSSFNLESLMVPSLLTISCHLVGLNFGPKKAAAVCSSMFSGKLLREPCPIVGRPCETVTPGTSSVDRVKQLLFVFVVP